MKLRKVAVQNIRSHTSRVIELAATTTILTGNNGVGKTSLLEGVYIALRGSSFRGSDSDILRYDSPWWRIDLQFDDLSTRTVTFDPSKQTGKKTFIIHDKKSHRLLSKDKYPIVLFEPEDLRLLQGSPSRRRLFIDHLIMQTNPLYSTQLYRYERALKQRNALLKQPQVSSEELFSWNIALSEYGAAIIEQRIAFTETINQRLESLYQSIAHTHDTISVHYSHTLIDYSAQKMMHELEQATAHDLQVGYTSKGPHRHDVEFLFNNASAAKVTSRGEARSIVLALKQIEEAIITETTGVQPILLLDDVFSELDEVRQGSLSYQTTSNQIIITSATHAVSESISGDQLSIINLESTTDK